jgi:hypothetical protein
VNARVFCTTSLLRVCDKQQQSNLGTLMNGPPKLGQCSRDQSDMDWAVLKNDHKASECGFSVLYIQVTFQNFHGLHN